MKADGRWPRLRGNLHQYQVALAQHSKTLCAIRFYMSRRPHICPAWLPGGMPPNFEQVLEFLTRLAGKIPVKYPKRIFPRLTWTGLDVGGPCPGTFGLNTKEPKIGVKLLTDANGGQLPDVQIEVQDNGSGFTAEAAQKAPAPAQRRFGFGLDRQPENHRDAPRQAGNCPASGRSPRGCPRFTAGGHRHFHRGVSQFPGNPPNRGQASCHIP